jgi:hypothetical protein
MEIKFRAWDTIRKRMEIGVGISCAGFNSCSRVDSKGITINPTSPGRYVIMQYTGLKDKNGKDGYHKDIVKQGKGLYTIEWQNEEARFWLAPLNHSGTWLFMDLLPSLVIIGNVYENPELLPKL